MESPLKKSVVATARSVWPLLGKSPATSDKAGGRTPSPSEIGGCGLERAVAVAQEHRDVVGAADRRRPGRGGRCR